MKIPRLSFVRGSVSVCLAGMLTAACGGDDDDKNSAGTAGKDGGGTACASTIANNHGHVLTISAADLAAGADKTYDITGSAGHKHTVTIEAEDFTDLKNGDTYIVTSSTDAGHSHEVEITC